MRDRYGNIRRHSRQWDIDKDINIGYVLSIWDMVIRYGYPPHRYGHPGYRYGTWANDMGDDSIDMRYGHSPYRYWISCHSDLDSLGGVTVSVSATKRLLLS